ncbi:MFS transporter [Cytobacillus firmus]|uniref:MFS transporter n=1 Tax=Cytobacillus firmus TaxID=1399 RepID=UPI00077C207B|nr:MFS transporter [Cytobacillus firmus]MBG9542221.1 MFS transporter [Cytobacillus firmus]MBG9547240.1 MFS transporter [Cytobacillus firmus]MBG9553758.1 MFS transporter [Cytobacillus firmus]MBG9557662.1 MFS transporter [Cytobacillus firmus]MBG9573757.1 MFS transporter [Cytobacillus firmus]
MSNSLAKKEFALTENPWRMLLFLLLSQLMVAFVGRSIGPLGVLIGEDLSLTKSQIGMLPAALFLGQAIISVPAGFLADLAGSRKLLVLASALMGLGYLFMTMLHEFWLVLLLIIIGGIGYGSMHPITNRGIIYWFPLKKRGTAMGIKQTGITAGSALASLILLPLSVSFGWRFVLLIACLLLLAGGFVSYHFYRDPPELEQAKSSSMNILQFYRSMFKMFKNKALMLISFSALGLNGTQMCLNTYIVLFAYEQLKIPIILSGLLLVISEVFGTIGRLAWGIISDRLFDGKRVIILMIITIITALASAAAAFISSAPFWVIAPITALFGFAASGFNGIWMNLASELVPKEQAGISSGISITLGSAGAIIIPPLFGYIVDQTGQFSSGWILITGMMAIVFTLLTTLSIMNKKNNIVI